LTRADRIRPTNRFSRNFFLEGDKTSVRATNKLIVIQMSPR
jgi:hypothetical protein